MKTNLKYLGIKICILLMFITNSSFAHSKINVKGDSLNRSIEKGKAFWFVSYMVDKKMYVTYIFTNDCNHCNNEILSSFKKFLVMNDYVSNPSTVNMIEYHDVTREKLSERRDEQIYKRKQQGYSVISLSFSYTED